jgi:hypothetical protein
VTLRSSAKPLESFEHDGTRYEIEGEAHDEPRGQASDAALPGDQGRDGPKPGARAREFRSFIIRNARSGERVFDSNRELERLLANLALNALDGSAGRRHVRLARVNGRLLVYVRLEELGGTAVLDLTDPRNPEFVDYHDPRMR